MNPLHLFKLAADTCSTGIFGGTGALSGPGLYDHLCNGKEVSVSSLSQILVVIGNVVRILITISGAIAVLMIIIGAIYYAISLGSPDRLKRAREIIQYAITGLVIILLAYPIISFVVKGFGG